MTGLDKLGFHTSFTLIPSGLISSFKVISAIVKSQERNSIFVVMSPAHVLSIYLKLVGADKIVLDAGWSLTEAEISRGFLSRIPQICKALIVDTMSFASADIVLVESKEEEKFLSKWHFKKRNRAIVTYTGANEVNLEIAPVCPRELANLPADFKYLLFRGKMNSEAGFNQILNIGSALSGTEFHLVVASPNMDISMIHSNNVIAIKRWLAQSEINYLYLNTTLVLGQFGSIPRLNRTIPHKYFEAMYFRKPYFSKMTNSIREISEGGKGVIEARLYNESHLTFDLRGILNDQRLLEEKIYEASQIRSSLVASENVAKKLVDDRKFQSLADYS